MAGEIVRVAVYINTAKEQDVADFIQGLGRGNFSAWVKKKIREENLIHAPSPAFEAAVEKVLRKHLAGMQMVTPVTDDNAPVPQIAARPVDTKKMAQDVALDLRASVLGMMGGD